MLASKQIAFGKAAGVKPEPSAYWGLCFTAEEDGSVVAMEAVGDAPPSVSLETSFDGSVWEPFYVGTTSYTLNKGERIYFKAGEGGNTAFATSTSKYNKFSLSTGKIAASGDIMSLLNGDVTSDTIPATYCFYYLFGDCTSLISAPELPATKTISSCYRYMFYGCTSLATAPELPATTIATFCYHSMFYGCTSLATAPELPAVKLMVCCYWQMFQGCSKLNEIEVAFSARSPTNATTNWVYGVSPTGTFRCPSALGTNETITRGTGACPEGWTVINTD